MRPYKVGSTFLVGPALPEGYSRKRTVERHRARVCLREVVFVPKFFLMVLFEILFLSSFKKQIFQK